MRSDFSFNPYSIVRVQSNNHRYCIKVLFSWGVPWVTLHAKNIIWLAYTSLSCSFMFPAGVAFSTQADAFIKCMESPRTRVVVQPCQRAVCHTIENVVTIIPTRNDRSEERLGLKVLQQLRSPNSARTEKNVKTDAVVMQVRSPQIDFTSNLALFVI